MFYGFIIGGERRGGGLFDLNRRTLGASKMIYPIHDQYGARIGTVMTEEGNPPQERWVAYTLHGERKAFASWDAAQQWVGEAASHPVRNDSPTA